MFLDRRHGTWRDRHRGGSAGSVSDDPYLFRTFVRVVQPSGGYGHVGTELVYATAEDLEPPFRVEPGQTTRGVNVAGLSFVIALAVPCS